MTFAWLGSNATKEEAVSAAAEAAHCHRHRTLNQTDCYQSLQILTHCPVCKRSHSKERIYQELN